MIKLLSYTPNLHTLTFQSMPLYKEIKKSIEQNEKFRLISKTNCIRNVTYEDRCTLDTVELLVILFPHLQHLTINTRSIHMKSILKFLLNKNNENTRDLALLSLVCASGNDINHLNNHIILENLRDRRKFIQIGYKLFLWCISKFEHLPNEIVYEIFEYLDYYHVYQSFFNLNRRFRSLLLQSTLLLKININFMSQSTFNRYNEDIIIPHTQEIKILRIRNYFMFDHTNVLRLSHKTSLQTLILERIESKSMKMILQQLTSLPNLSSLTITTLRPILIKNSIYQQIFCLSSLRFCKLSFGENYDEESLPLAMDKYSAIKHLILDHSIPIDHLDAFLSYVPYLRYFSAILVYINNHMSINMSSRVLNHLKHVNLRLTYGIEYFDLEQIFSKYFPLIEILHISGDHRQMDANIWQSIIQLYLTKLRIFDIFFQRSMCNEVEIEEFLTQVNRYKSSFWTKRQWFYEYQIKSNEFPTYITLFSTNPYRRKDYRLYKDSDRILTINNEQTIISSVDHIYIKSIIEIIKCRCYFPNVTTLTFDYGFHLSITLNLIHLLSLKQLKMLRIRSAALPFIELIQFLYCTPNIQTLIFDIRSMPLYSIEEEETFQSVSNTNCITNVTFKRKCTIEELKILFILCPRLQYLQIPIEIDELELILQFLFDTNNKNITHLVSLCISNVTESYLDYFHNLILSEKVFYQHNMLYVIEIGKLYLWWS